MASQVMEKGVYIKDLQKQMKEKPTKMQEYRDKLAERELYQHDNILDNFGKAGAGAPLKSPDGNVVTKRRTLLNDRYEEIMLRNQANNASNQFRQHHSPSPYKSSNEQRMMSQLNHYQDLTRSMPSHPQHNPPMTSMTFDNNILSRSSSIPNNLMSIYPIPMPIPFYHNPYAFMNNPFYHNPIPSNSYDNPSHQQINATDRGSYEHIPKLSSPSRRDNSPGILPREHPNDNTENNKRALRETWLRQIQDKADAKAREKLKQDEIDKYEEDRWDLQVQELKQRDKRDAILKAAQAFPLDPLPNSIKKETQPIKKLQSPYKSSDANAIEQTFHALNQQQQQDNNYQDHYKRINEINFIRPLEDTVSNQINKLQTDVNGQYIEMSNLFGRLKGNLVDLDREKSTAEREHHFIRDQLLQHKMKNMLYENKLSYLIERNNAYQNFALPSMTKNAIPVFVPNNNHKHKNLKSTSAMVYANDVIVEEGKPMSNLAMIGQNLVGESEFVPINTGHAETEEVEKNIVDTDMADLPVPRRQSYTNEGIQAKANLLKEFKEKEGLIDMYEKLGDIQHINHQMNPMNKYSTMAKNLEVDYNAYGKNRANDEIKRLDQMLREIDSATVKIK